MSAGSPPVLHVTALEGQRGERTLFRGLELTLQPGEIVWLRGRNGRGKTILLRLLAGLATPATGEIRIAGRRVRGDGSAVRESLLYIGHANALKDDLAASEALSFLGALHGRRPAPEAVAQARSCGQPSRGLTRRRSDRPKLSITRAAAPMFSPNCGCDRMIAGPAIRAAPQPCAARSRGLNSLRN